eukprot:COSAG01_NODE_61174_length_290_cov_23.790576_1_plen_43_part_01
MPVVHWNQTGDHWTQVTEPGWKILGVGGGGSGYLDGTTWQSGT